MEEIKKLENKIKRDQKYLIRLENEKFNKNQNSCSRKEKKQQRSIEWLAIKNIIKSHIKLAIIKKQKLVMSELALAIGMTDKTAKRYYQLVLDNQDLKFNYNPNSAWNSQATLREKVIAKILEAIERTDKHMGEKVALSLSDLIDDIREDFPGVELKYKTVYRWVRNDYDIDYKYQTHKRKRILKQVKKVRERLDASLAQLKLLKQMKAKKLKTAIVEEVNEIINQTKVKKLSKDAFMLPGSIIQMDGGQDIMYQHIRINRLQAVDLTGYSYSIIYTPTETNRTYLKALIEVLKVTTPAVLLVEGRRGVDPSDDKALVASVCQNLGITIIASSNPNHKSLVEKDHGLVRSKGALYFSKHNIKILAEAEAHAQTINDHFNKKHNYQQPQQNGEKIGNQIIDFLNWDLQATRVISQDFIYFKQEAYEVFENREVVDLDTNWVYVVGKKDDQVRVLCNKKLYYTRLIPKINLKSEEFANILLRSKFQQNAKIVMTKESARFWIKSETKAIVNHTERKMQQKYQQKMSVLFQENYWLKEQLKKKAQD